MTLAGWTPLFAAAERGHIDVAKELIEDWKANKDQLSHEGTTPLYHAACKGKTDMCRYLVETARAKVDGVDSKDNWTPLQGAVYYSRVDTVDYLIKAGADVNAHNSKQKAYTALHFAIGRKEPLTSAIVALLEHPKIDIDALNANGASALHLAALWGHVDVARRLLAKKANATLLTKKGVSPLQMAIDNDKMDVASVIAEHTGEPFDIAAAREIAATRKKTAIRCV